MKNLIKIIILMFSLTLISPLVTDVLALENANIIGTASITMDIDTGEVIYSKNAELKHSPASTTKLLTSLIFAENKSKTDLIPYTETSANLRETTLNSNFMGNTVVAGDTMTADDVMKAVMIFSANDASILMAESVAGSVDNFASMMNTKAKELGALNSNFINPNGLEIDSNNYNTTTAYDLALISIAAYKNDWIKETMALNKTSVNLKGLNISFDTRNKNLGKDGNVGGKTGTETLAGHCFVGFYERNGRNLVTVVLGSEYGADGTNVFKDTATIANYSYEASKEPFKNSGDEVGSVTLEYKLFRFFGPTKTITAPIVLSQDVEYYKNDFNDTHGKIQFTGDVSNGWKVASNKDADLTFSIVNYAENIKGKITLTTGDLLKANLPIYLATLLITIVIIALIIIVIRVINMSRRRNRNSKYYR